MQSIAATAGLGIDQRDRQIVAAEKPGENAGCDRFPFGVAIRAPGRQAGGDRRRRLQRLLIERAGGWRSSPKPSVPTGRK